MEISEENCEACEATLLSISYHKVAFFNKIY